MPTFSRHVPQDPRGPAFPIIRTPVNRPLVAIVTSPDLVGCFTHYFKGRTVPHEDGTCRHCNDKNPRLTDEDAHAYHNINGEKLKCARDACEACNSGMPHRWHSYQSVYVITGHAHCLYECTAQASEHFTEYRDAHGTLRGCLFEAFRYNRRPNGRIIIRTKPADLTDITLPQPPDLVKVLSILWGFSADDCARGAINPEKKTQTLTAHPRPNTDP